MFSGWLFWDLLLRIISEAESDRVMGSSLTRALNSSLVSVVSKLSLLSIIITTTTTTI